MKVLIADDDGSTRTMLNAMVRKWGFEVETVADGQAALDALQRGEDAPALAVVDWGMPALSGVSVCQRIRDVPLEAQPYIILLTARQEQEDLVHGLDAGANDYIKKPCDMEELYARLRVGRRMVEMQTEMLAAQKALTYQAFHDSLTGALNRCAILDALEKEVVRAQRTTQSLGVGILDLDHFKDINDTHGHQAGDDVLTGVVQRLQEHCRSYDHLGRYGGEEFLVIAPGIPGHDLFGFFDRLRGGVANAPLPTRKGPLEVTMSTGVTRFESESTVDSLLAAADRALYRAKDRGRNLVVLDPAKFSRQAERHE